MRSVYRKKTQHHIGIEYYRIVESICQGHSGRLSPCVSHSVILAIIQRRIFVSINRTYLPTQGHLWVGQIFYDILTRVPSWLWLEFLVTLIGYRLAYHSIVLPRYSKVLRSHSAEMAHRKNHNLNFTDIDSALDWNLHVLPAKSGARMLSGSLIGKMTLESIGHRPKWANIQCSHWSGDWSWADNESRTIATRAEKSQQNP